MFPSVFTLMMSTTTSSKICEHNSHQIIIIYTESQIIALL